MVNRLPMLCTSAALKAPAERRKHVSRIKISGLAEQPVASASADSQARQETQAELPAPFATVPSGHALHLWPPAANWPAGHSLHGSSPGSRRCLPAGHCTQRPELSTNSLSAGHRISTSPTSAMKCSSSLHFTPLYSWHQHRRCLPALTLSSVSRPKSYTALELFASAQPSFASPQTDRMRIQSPSETRKPMFATVRLLPRIRLWSRR
mmetsp:Transcript_8670/g.20393  ORF Transcript_8670/g.20393 Transcript_8670/m.20393 type:complete len:208 (-) Transcript_8670:62-685(-)